MHSILAAKSGARIESEERAWLHAENKQKLQCRSWRSLKGEGRGGGGDVVRCTPEQLVQTLHNRGFLSHDDHPRCVHVQTMNGIWRPAYIPVEISSLLNALWLGQKVHTYFIFRRAGSTTPKIHSCTSDMRRAVAW